MIDITRRGTLGLMAGAAATLARGRHASAADDDSFDLAIAGAGVSGVYLAWRVAGAPQHELEAAGLTRPGARPRIAVFETSRRIGGRLWSYALPGMPHVFGELGGMRFGESQKLVANLIPTLGIAVADFAVDEPGNPLYLRGHRLHHSDAETTDRLPYNLDAAERGRTVSELFDAALRRAFPGIEKLDAAELNELARNGRFDGLPLDAASLEALLMRFRSREYVQLYEDLSGYDLSLATVPLSGVVPFYPNASGDPHSFRAPIGGYETLPRRLADTAGKAGTDVLLGHRLRAVAAPDATGAMALTVDGPQGARSHVARHVVLALPRRSLELIGNGLFFWSDRSFQAGLDSVHGIQADKLLLGFEQPWWRQLGITKGRAVSDLPLRQTFYWGTEDEQPGGEPGNTRSLMLASYNQGGPEAFWTSFFGGASPQDPAEPYGGKAALEVPAEIRAPQAMVEEAVRELTAIHGPGVTVPPPYAAAQCNWSVDPFGAAWHHWKLGVAGQDIMPRMRHPVPGAALAIVGECWSSAHGWVEGALMTAERVAQDRFGLSRPSWLPAGYDLGA